MHMIPNSDHNSEGLNIHRGYRSDLSKATTVIVVILSSSIATAVVPSGGGSGTAAPESRLPSMHVRHMAGGRCVASRTQITANPTYQNTNHARTEESNEGSANIITQEEKEHFELT